MGAAMGSDASVYVVDDDDDVRTGLCRLLRSAGWDVLDFASAPAFLEAYDPERVSCLLLDVSMPEMTGPELHETLGDRGIDIPVVFLTGKGDVGTSVRALKRGALDFLEKPVDAEVLLDAIGAANGFTKDAAKKKVFLIHKDQQGEPIKLNLNDILKKGDISQNHTLAEGDLLYLTSN